MYKIIKYNFLILILFNFFFTKSKVNNIHVIGDSHSVSFNQIKYCNIHYIGSITMHRVGRDGLKVLDLRKFDIKENDLVVFSFGEIDTRVHIGKERDLKARNLDEIIETLVTNYIKTINLNRLNYKNIYCIVFCIVPPTNQKFNPDYSFYGTLKDRVSITKKLNEYLEKKSIENNIYTINAYNDYCTKEGFLNKDLSDGSVHINHLFYEPLKMYLDSIILKINNAYINP